MARGFGYRTLSLVMLCTHFFNHFNHALRRFSLGGAGRGGARRGEGGGTSVGGGRSQQLHYYCSHGFESLPSEVGEMNEFSVGGNHTHLSTYRTTTVPSAPPTCHLLSVGKCGCFCWEEKNVEGMHAQRQLRSPSVTRSSRRNSSFLWWRSQMPPYVFSFPHALSGLGGYSILSIIAGSGSLNPPGSLSSLAVFFFKENRKASLGSSYFRL